MRNFNVVLINKETRLLLVVGVFILALAVSMVAIQGWTSRKDLDQAQPGIDNFEECVAAGYPIDRYLIYPRRCRTPDGRVFLEESVDEEFVIDVSCQIDTDCQLINKELWIDCCGNNGCQPVDYSKDKWVAVNKDWLIQKKTKNCTREKMMCPLCNPKPINDSFGTQCINRMCQKVPK